MHTVGVCVRAARGDFLVLFLLGASRAGIADGFAHTRARPAAHHTINRTAHRPLQPSPTRRSPNTTHTLDRATNTPLAAAAKKQKKEKKTSSCASAAYTRGDGARARRRRGE
jgi:hypothetical protein